MPHAQLSCSETLNSNLSNTPNRTTSSDRNQSARRGRLKKPSNKCLQNNLIYAMYLPEQFGEEKMIKDENHFGRYGNVTTIIYTSDSQQSHLQAYITYSNQKEAALAIMAVNEIGYGSRAMRTTYGTNRMCNSFYSGDKCVVKNCFYLHDQKSRMNIQGPLKTDFDKQKVMAQDIVKNNLLYYIQKIQHFKLQQHQPNSTNTNSRHIYFPTIQQAINTSIIKNIINQTAYRQAYQQYLSSKKKITSSVPKIQYIRYTPKPKSNKQSPPSQAHQLHLKHYVTHQSHLHKQTKELKNQFLMNPILISLNQLTQQQKQYNSSNKSTKLKEFQIVGKTQEPLSIYWQFLDKNDDSNSDQLQTEESQSQLEHPDSLSISYQCPPMDPKRENSSPEFPRDDCNIQTRLKQQILRNRLIKKSRMQFADTTGALEKGKQFQKVTQLLRNSLIQ